MSNMYAIEIRDLYKSHGMVKAIRGENIAVKRGELFGFIGPNRAGNTTTIHCMLDMVRPQ